MFTNLHSNEKKKCKCPLMFKSLQKTEKNTITIFLILGSKKYDGHCPTALDSLGKLNGSQTEISIPSGIREVLIDTSLRMADINKLDNTTGCNTVWNFDHKILESTKPQ